MKRKYRSGFKHLGNWEVCLAIGAIALAVIVPVALQFQRNARALALCKAAKAGDVIQVRSLLQSGADPNRFNTLGYARMRVEQGGENKEVIALLESVGAKDKRKGMKEVP